MNDDVRRWAVHENRLFYGQVRQKRASVHGNEPFCGCRVERVTELCVKRETIKIETKMKKQMKRTVYEAPVTELFRVELEGDFMAASVVEYEHSVETNVHEENLIDASNYTDAGGTEHNWNNDSEWL